MNKINFEDGQLVSPAYVKEDGTIEEAVYEGETPLSSFNLNKMQDNTEEAINELDPSMLEVEATEVNNEDLLLLVQGGEKKKIPVSKVIKTINVIDNLESDSATDALSAKQGKVLKEKIEQRTTTGQEYATNEYIDDKRVYGKRIDIGVLPNNTTKKVVHGLTNFKLVRISGLATTTSDNYTITLPCLNDAGFAYCVALTVSNTEVEIKAGSNRTTYTGYVDLYYTKNNEEV